MGTELMEMASTVAVYKEKLVNVLILFTLHSKESKHGQFTGPFPSQCLEKAGPQAGPAGSYCWRGKL